MPSTSPSKRQPLTTVTSLKPNLPAKLKNPRPRSSTTRHKRGRAYLGQWCVRGLGFRYKGGGGVGGGMGMGILALLENVGVRPS